MKSLLLVASALGLASAADAWTCTSPVNGYKVTAAMTAAPHGLHALRVALASDEGQPTAMKLHAWFIDADGMILDEAPLIQPQASGATLVAADTGVKVPASAASLVVLAQPANGAARAIVTQFALPGD